MVWISKIVESWEKKLGLIDPNFLTLSHNRKGLLQISPFLVERIRVREGRGQSRISFWYFSRHFTKLFEPPSNLERNCIEGFEGKRKEMVGVLAKSLIRMEYFDEKSTEMIIFWLAPSLSHPISPKMARLGEFKGVRVLILFLEFWFCEFYFSPPVYVPCSLLEIRFVCGI